MGASLIRDAAKAGHRVEARRGIDHRRTVRLAGEIYHHHAEAMIKRDGNADPVARAQPRANADLRAIGEAVAVRAHSDLRTPRRAASALDLHIVARGGADTLQVGTLHLN